MIRWIRRLLLPKAVKKSLANIEAEIEKLSREPKPDYRINGTEIYWSAHLLNVAETRSFLLSDIHDAPGKVEEIGDETWVGHEFSVDEST